MPLPRLSAQCNKLHLFSRILFSAYNVHGTKNIHTQKPRPITKLVCFGNGEQHVYMSPECKIALITGGTSGPGMAAASELLANHANRVILTGVNRDEGKEAVEKLTNQFGKQKAMFLLGDVSNIYEFERIFKQVISECQKIDILFNNAEIADDEQWEKEIDINIQGVLCGTLLAFKYMGKRSGANGGVVINNASIVGFEALPHAPIYSASKHAVVSLTRNMGAQYHYNQTGLRVVALCPGVKQSVYTSSLYGRRLMKQKKESMKKFSNLHFMESSPGTIGRAVVHLIRSAPSGTLWSLENTVLSQIHIPPSKQYLKLVKNFNKLK